MAFKLSKFEIGMIVAFVVVTGAGIGGYIYTSGLVETAKSDLTTANGELQKLVKQKYLPSDANIKTLEGNVNALRSVLDPIEKQVLQSPECKLSEIKAQNPVTWKNSELDQTVQRLTAQARSRRLTLPPDYYFGFARYQKSNPSEQATLILGKQLYGVEQLATKLFEINETGAVVSLKSIRRTLDEDAAGASSSGADGADSLRGTSVLGASKLYRVYPFEVEFVGNTTGLRTFLNSLIKGPVLFIVRSVQVTNSKIESPKQADLGKSAGNEKNGRDFIFGGEQLAVKVRVDMIEWLGTQGAEAAGAAKPAQGAKR